MDKKVIIGGLVGALVTLMFALGILFLLEGLLSELISSISNLAVSFITILLAPVAGGFLAGLIGRSNPLQAGLIAGVAAGIILFAAWVVITGFSIETLLSAVVIIFVWVVMARLASGFARPKKNL